MQRFGVQRRRLCLVLATSSFMNISAFPLFDHVFTYARDISVLANAACLVVVALVASFSLFFAQLSYRQYCGTCYFGFWLNGYRCVIRNAVVLAARALFVLSCRRAWMVSVVVGVSLLRFPISDIAQSVTLAFLGNCAFAYAAWLLPSSVGLLAFFVAPLAALLLARGVAKPVLAEVAASDSPADIAITQPSSFLALGSQLFVCLFLFRVAFGFSLRFGEVDGAPLADFFSIVPIGFWPYTLLPRQASS